MWVVYLMTVVLSLWLTTVLLMWSCKESISRSPTGCQVALASSARVSRRSRWSMELCSSWSRSNARSTWLCQPPTCPFRRSHRSLTSPVCLRMARAKPRAFSSGVRSLDREGKKEETRTVLSLYWSLMYAPHDYMVLMRITILEMTYLLLLIILEIELLH